MKYGRWGAWLGAGWLAAALVAGCKGSDESPGEPVPIEQFPQTFAKALCDAVAPCCGEAGLPYAKADCDGKATEWFTSYATRGSGGNTNYDPAAARNCLDALEDELKSCKTPSLYDPACSKVFVGTLKNGEMCKDPLECESGRCVGTCTPALDIGVHGKEGDDCAGSCVTMSDGELYCPTASLSGPAGLPVGTGTAFCHDTDGLYCRVSPPQSGAPTAKCTVYAQLDASCTDVACAPGSYCDRDQELCVAQVDSGACMDPNACTSANYCAGVQAFSAGQCTARKPDGFACSADDECLSRVCHGGTDAHPTCGYSNDVNKYDCAGTF